MDVENQKHMLLWSRLEDVVQMLHRMYSFFLTSFPDSFVDDFEEWEKKKVTRADGTPLIFLVKIQTAIDTMTQNSLY